VHADARNPSPAFPEEEVPVTEARTASTRPALGAPPDGDGMYLYWEGRRSYRTKIPKPRVLEPVPELSYGAGENRIIEGDNLQTMVSLRAQYRGMVQVAYIDPPYNTGKGDFRYSDRRTHDPDADDDEAVYVTNEDGGRHTKWLNYMGPRLSLVQELLDDNGVCFVSISDTELFRLGLLMDEVFGERNRVGVIVWKAATENNPTRIAIDHEYILCYAKRIETLPRIWLGDSPGKDWMLSTYHRLKGEYSDRLGELRIAFEKEVKEQAGAYKKAAEVGEATDGLMDLSGLERYTNIDPRGPYAAIRNTDNPRPGGYEYEVRHPKTGQLYARPKNGYRFPEESMRRLQDADRVVYPRDPRRLVQLKKYLVEVRAPLRSVIELDSRAGANDLKRLFPDGSVRFPNPKPVRLLEKLIAFAGDSDALVLDAWAGSGTTAHAVLRLNAQDYGTRRFILVEEGTPSDRFCRTVTAARVRAAIDKEGLHGEFRFERTGRRLDRDAIVELEREAIANLIIQTDATGTGRGIRRITNTEYVIGANARGEAICLRWNGRGSSITPEILGAMYGEVDALGLKRPLRVYASTCQVGETPSFRFCQIPDEILARLSLEEDGDDPDLTNMEALEQATHIRHSSTDAVLMPGGA
jgi:adenine-specific DNA-methyltransferase